MSDNDRHANEEIAADSNLPVDDLNSKAVDELDAEDVKGGSITRKIDVASPILFQNAVSETHT